MDNDLKRKIDLVNGYIGKLASELTGQLVGELVENKGLEKKLIIGLKEIILDNLKGSDQATSFLIEIISRENLEVSGELAEKTEKAVLGLSQWIEKNNDVVVAYRTESSKTNSGEGTNPNVIDKQVKTQTLAKNLNKVYNSEIEDQTSMDLEEINTESVGRVYNAPTNAQSVVVLSKEIPKQFESNIGGDQKITTGVADAPQNLAKSGVNLLENSAKNRLSKLKIGVKDGLGKVFDKAGPSLVNGLNSAVSASNKLTFPLKTKLLAPLLIGFFVVFFVFNLISINGKASGLLPRIETKEGTGGGGGVGESPKYGEITMTEDGRIRDCGVGMEADFIRRKHTSRVNPNVLSSGVYDEQLKEAVGEHFGTRCGVVYAAQYLAYDFEYWVPYYWAGKYAKRGLNPRWGAETHPDHSGRIYQGLDCSGFNAWTQYNGYGGRNRGGSAISFGGDCARIKSIIEPGDTLTLGDGSEGTYHVAVVLAYDDKYIKFAHSGGGSGVSTGLIGICSGRLVNGNMTFEYLHHKNYKK